MSNNINFNHTINPNPNGCNFYVIRKKRFCRLLAKDGEQYCAEHSLPVSSTVTDQETAGDVNRRVVCPLDNKHTCYANKLQKHLKICNARPGRTLPYISTGINAGSTKNNISSDTTRCINNKDISEILKVITKINKIFKDYIENAVTVLICKNDYVEEQVEIPEFGPRTKKHLKQVSSLIGIMEKYELFQPDTCYIELGAGKGHLSYWVYKTVEQIKNTNLLLIERASHRHKFDNKLEKENGRVCRIRADIADLILHKVDIVERSKFVVGFAKHLCGEATDLALRCLVNCNENCKELLGIALAFCCHHKCYWSSYVGKTFLQDVGLNESDFDIMCGMVSWATCGTGKSREWTCEKDNINNEEKLNNRYEEVGLTTQDKEEIGRKCKLIINWGRKAYLEEKGYRCFLHFYVHENVTLENVCLVAHNIR